MSAVIRNKENFYFPFGYGIINMSEMSGTVLGRVAQLGERLVRNEEVVGSIPITSKFFNKKMPLRKRGHFFLKKYLLGIRGAAHASAPKVVRGPILKIGLLALVFPAVIMYPFYVRVE